MSCTNTLRFLSWLTLWLLFSGTAIAETKCDGSDKSKWTNCVGEVTTPKGQKYIGEFRGGKRTGKGAYTYPHGLKYEGDFVNGRYNGQGTLSQPDGSKYVGTFENDVANGDGTEFGVDGAVLRAGLWKDGFFFKGATDISPRAAEQGVTAAGINGVPPPVDFMGWLSESADRNQHYVELTEFLTQNGVINVVPTWQLLIPDTDLSSEKCPVETYVFPPQALWHNVVLTLRLIRSDVIPVVGALSIKSGYRSPMFNKCVGGAKNSVHTTFSALDVGPIEYSDVEQVLRKMCERWARLPTVKFGLGAYFNPKNPTGNAIARFHVDTSKVLGRRTWGYDYTYKSSYCNRLPQT